MYVNLCSHTLWWSTFFCATLHNSHKEQPFLNDEDSRLLSVCLDISLPVCLVEDKGTSFGLQGGYAISRQG